ncbi:hypothetical protein N0V85_005222 [Neurospora sp. IMI 360204]|nr:hypothetical protein N0V85_005222 [Neurospora sp. IMI 360204]
MAQVGVFAGLPPFSPSTAFASSLLGTQDDGQNRSLFLDTVDIGRLYIAVNVVIFPPVPRFLPPSHTTITNGVSKDTPNGINGHGEDENRRPHTPTQFDIFLRGLDEIGFGSPKLSDTDISVFTLIFPKTSGHVIRHDFLQLRLQDSPIPVIRIYHRFRVLHYHNGIREADFNADQCIGSLVKNAGGIIQWGEVSSYSAISQLQRYRAKITQELLYRFNDVSMLSPKPIESKTVALIRGRPNLMTGGPVYAASKALGLKLVIIDEPGHWLEADTEENRNIREAFLTTDLTEDDTVVDRIIASIRSYDHPIHGVFTLSDNFFVAVAKVAETLGLPCGPVSAFETAVDKYKSRMLQDAPGHTARVTSVAELEALLAAPKDGSTPFFTPKFPVIVKPTKGWSSECVSKVRKPRHLARAVEKATARHGSAAVIEPFFDGPEIDVNFVLLDGEILFCEIADEPPCEADSAKAKVSDTFSPVALTLPSSLPEDEQEMVRDTLHKILLKIGFTTGIFHLEARVVNSKAEYCIGPGFEMLTFKHKDRMPAEKAECKLIEINARPPGYRVSVPSRHTYGVDYFAVRMLAAVDDKERLREVAKPFGHVESPSYRTPGAQYWSRLVYIPVPKDGIVKWKEHEELGLISPSEDLKLRRPDLAEHIVLAVDYHKDGDKVIKFTDGARTYLGHILVKHTYDRDEAITIGNEVLEEYFVNIHDG